MPVVLLTAAGTGTAFAAAAALRRHWADGVKIVAADTNPPHLVATALLADVSERLPLSSASDFVPALEGVIRKHAVDTYFPFIDSEIALAARMRDAGRLPEHVYVLAPSAGAAELTVDKLACSAWLCQRDIPSPRTALASDPFDAERYFLKPRAGFGSHGARIANPGDLEKIPPEERFQWVIQDVCEGPETTIDCFLDPSTDFFRASCRERLETKAGVCTKARIHFDRQLEALSKRVGSELGLTGTYCIQVMKHDGAWQVTDVNARPGAATAMSVAIGLDFFAASFARAWGQDYSRFFPLVAEEAFVTRQYCEFVMSK